MVVPNLTKSSFQIYILDPNKYLADIYWESCSEISMSSDVIRTSNGRKIYQMGTKPVPQELTITKAANTEEDVKVEKWLREYCQGAPPIEGMSPTGSVLMLIPLKPCSQDEPYPQRIKVYDLFPTKRSMWSADVLSNTDVAKISISCQFSDYTLE